MGRDYVTAKPKQDTVTRHSELEKERMIRQFTNFTKSQSLRVIHYVSQIIQLPVHNYEAPFHIIFTS